MNKKSHFIASLLFLFANFQTQASSDKDLTGLALFGSSIACWKIAQSWKSSQNTTKKSTSYDDMPALEPNPHDPKNHHQDINQWTQQDFKALQQKAINKSKQNAKPLPPVRYSSQITPNTAVSITDNNDFQQLQPHQALDNHLQTKLNNQNKKAMRIYLDSKNAYEYELKEQEQRDSDKKKLKQKFRARQQQKQPILLLTNEPEFKAEEYKSHISNKALIKLSRINSTNNHKDELARQAVMTSLRDPKREMLEIHLQEKLYNTALNQQAQSIHEASKKKKDKQDLLQQVDQCYRNNNIQAAQTLLAKHILPFSDHKTVTELAFCPQSPSSNSHGRISTRHTYHQKGILPKKVIFLSTVHGTWSNPKSYGQDEQKSLTPSFLAYAQRLAIEQDALVYLDVIQWTGKLDRKARKEAGIAIAELLMANIKEVQEERKNSNLEISIQTIGHSHGCNVINFMAKRLNDENHSIDHAIFLGSPKSDVETSNIRQICNMFGNLDFTGSMGSILSSWGKTSSLRKETDNQSTTKVQNVIVKAEGQDLNHTTIKYVAMNHLPLILNYLQQNFHSQQDLIIDIHDTNKDIQEEHSDADEFHDAATTLPCNYQVSGMIDEVYSSDGCDYEQVNNPDVKLSDDNKANFEKRYKRSIYEQSDLLTGAMSEGQTAGVPLFILTTLQQTKNAMDYTQVITEYGQRLINYIGTLFRSSSPTSITTNPSFESLPAVVISLDQKIKDAQQALAKEPSLKEKSLIIAKLYATANESDDPEEQITTLQTINLALKKENSQLTAWQYNYEWIIGKRRTAENASWTSSEKEQLAQAKAIYERLQQNPTANLSGYENLDNATQQALLSALEQGLKIKDIQKII